MNLYPDLLKYLYLNHLNEESSIRSFALLNKECHAIARKHINEKQNQLYEIVHIDAYLPAFKTIIHQSRTGTKKIVSEYYYQHIWKRTSYLGNKQHGLYERYTWGSRKLIAKGYYRDGNPIGAHERWSKTNNRYYAKYSYIDGKKEGLFESFYPNGRLKTQFYYINNKIEGAYKQWSPTGQRICKCYFKNNKLNGYYRKWHYNGQVRVQCYYINGVIVARTI